MNPAYENLFTEMLHDINRCMKLPHPSTENAERSFWIAKNYWDKLKEFVKKKGFKDASQEIEFFREVKPQFTCYIEYFAILSEALQFAPTATAIPDGVAEFLTEEQWQVAMVKCTIEYWEKEGKRYKRFCDRHGEFIQYINSGDRHKDSVYFLREHDAFKDVKGLPSFDIDKEFSTYHEQLLRSYLANKKYYEFASERMEILLKTDQSANR